MTGLLLVSALLALSFAQGIVAEPSGGRLLLKDNFDQVAVDGFAARALRDEHIELARGVGPDASDAIRAAYIGYERGSERVLLSYPLEAKVRCATLSFDVCFPTGFQWVHGGKLHGLGPKQPVTGGNDRKPGSWSARIMFNENGECSTYLYDQNKTEKYGTGNSSGSSVFKAGKWHHVDFQMRLNDPGNPNGFARILIDSKPVVTTDRVVFRKTGGPCTLIQQFLFNTFHGGHDPTWSPLDENNNPTTVYAYFDNFLITGGIQEDRSTANEDSNR